MYTSYHGMFEKVVGTYRPKNGGDMSQSSQQQITPIHFITFITFYTPITFYYLKWKKTSILGWLIKHYIKKQMSQGVMCKTQITQKWLSLTQCCLHLNLFHKH